MAKGDHDRGERRIDEQMKQSQSYLTGIQQQLANQYGGISNYYSGGFPQVGNTYGWGTTVPHYSPNGPIFSGNDTDKPVYGTGPSGSASNPINVSPGQAAGDYRSQFNSLFPGENLTPQMLAAKEKELAAMGMRLMGPNARGERTKIMLPNGQSVDLIHGAGSGRNEKQWMVEGGGSPYGSQGGMGFGGGFNPAGGAAGLAFNDYGNISSQYDDVLGRWGAFAENGGFSEEDKSNIRARAISPIRSIYSRGRSELDRQRALQGGYSPGFTTALGRFNREQGQLTSDATTNAEAAIAEMVQRGKLAGLGGMTGTLGGKAGLYGTTPGLANMFGNQTLQSMSQQLQAAGLQNQLGLGQINAQLGLSQVPGNFDTFMNSIGGIGRAGMQVGGAIYPWLPSGGMGGGNPAGNMPTPWGYG